MRSPGKHYKLLWGAATHADGHHGQQALELCDYYIAKDISGVFFAPLEHTPEKNEVNTRVVDAFEKAGIPLVLLDRDAVDQPQRSRCDLVGIDNRRAGYLVTQNLLDHGCKRLVFVASPNSAPTVGQRMSGYADALKRSGIPEMLAIGDVDSVKWISRIAVEHEPDGFVCENDRTAGRLMLHLNELGFEIPSKMKIIGIDDVKYASLLHAL